MNADEAPLIFSRKLGMLAPANQAAAEALRAIEGNVVVKITKANRNQARRALYWQVCSIVAQAINDAQGMNLTEDELHSITRKKLGLFDAVTLPSGDVFYRMHSTSDRAMNESDRARYTDRAFRVWANWLGIDPETLVREGTNAG